MSAHATTRSGVRPNLPAFAVAAVLGVTLVVVAAMASGLWASRAGAESVVAVQNSPAAAAGPNSCSVCGKVVAIRTYELRDDGSVSRTATASGVKHAYRESVGSLFGAAEPVGQLVYRVTVRMDDGSFRTLSQRGPPGFEPGVRVKVFNGAVSPRT